MIAAIVKTTYYFASITADIINPALATPTKLAAAKIGLGTGVFTPSPSSTYADCVEATFTGYAQSATVVWGSPLNEADGSVTSQSPSHLFRCTASGTSESITNVFVTDGVAPTATGILGIAPVSPSIPIVNSGDGFSVLIDWNEGATPGNCNATIIV